MFGINIETILGIVRNILLAIGAGLVTKGVIDADTLQNVVGAIIIIASAAFSYVSNNTKAKAVAVVKAVEASPKVDLIPASESGTGKPQISVVK